MSKYDNYPSNMRAIMEQSDSDDEQLTPIEVEANVYDESNDVSEESKSIDLEEVDPAQAGRERKQKEDDERKKAHDANQLFLADRLAAKNEELSLKEKRIAELEAKSIRADELELKFKEEKEKAEESKTFLSETARELLGEEVANELETHIRGSKKSVSDSDISELVAKTLKKEREEDASAVKKTRQELFFHKVGVEVPELSRLHSDPDFVSFLSNTPLDFELAKKLNTPTALGALNAFAENQDVDSVQKIRELVDLYLNKDAGTKDKKELSSGMPNQMATPKMVSKKREMTEKDLAKAKSILRNEPSRYESFMAQFE